MLIRVGQLLQPADNVSAREIPLGVTKILLRQAEVLSGGTEAAMVVAVAVVAVVTVVAMVAMVVVVVVEQITQETSHETSREKTEHDLLLFARGARACSMPTLQVPRLLCADAARRVHPCQIMCVRRITLPSSAA
jgi:hypothetical protein